MIADDTSAVDSDKTLTEAVEDSTVKTTVVKGRFNIEGRVKFQENNDSDIKDNDRNNSGTKTYSEAVTAVEEPVLEPVIATPDITAGIEPVLAAADVASGGDGDVTKPAAVEGEVVEGTVGSSGSGRAQDEEGDGEGEGDGDGDGDGDGEGEDDEKKKEEEDEVLYLFTRKL